MGQFTLLLLLCVGLDVSNPLLPGSQRFNPDECIEMAHVERARAGNPTERIAFRLGPDRPPPREVRQSMKPARTDTLRTLLLPLYRPRDPGDLPPPSEDH